MSELVRCYLPLVSAVIVFAVMHYCIYCFGAQPYDKRDKRFLIIALILFFPSLILMMFTANFVELLK